MVQEVTAGWGAVSAGRETLLTGLILHRLTPVLDDTCLTLADVRVFFGELEEKIFAQSHVVGKDFGPTTSINPLPAGAASLR